MKNGNVVDNVPVSLWNNILNGWSASEAEVLALKEQAVADSVVLSAKNREIALIDSVKSVVIVERDQCLVEVEKERGISEKYFEIVKKGCPPQRKPFLLNPWTYVGALAVFAGGVYVGSR